MTNIPDIEPILDSWLAEGTDVLPDRSVEAVLRTVDRTSQRRAWGLPWREHDMNGSSRLAVLAGAAIVVVLVVGGLVYLGGSQGSTVGGGGGSAPTPTPMATPTPSAPPGPTPSRVPTADELLDTSKWTTYDSAKYGFSIAHPADWSVHPGTGGWDIATHADDDFGGGDVPDVLCSPDGGPTGRGSVCASIWSSTVAPGTTVEAWMESYCTAQNADLPCAGIADRAVPIVMGGQRPGLGLFDDPTQAFFIDGGTVYVAAVWYGAADPELRPYGGGRALLEAFTSTLAPAALPASPAPSP